MLKVNNKNKNFRRKHEEMVADV